MLQLFVDQKDCGNLVQVGQFATPLLHGAGAYVFLGGSKPCSYAQAGLRAASLENIGHHPGVAIGRLDKELSLPFAIRTLLQSLESPDTLIRFDGKVSVERETLSVNP